MSKRPTTVAIDHDDHHARRIGRTADGRQFFVTEPFVAESRGVPRREFLAVYLFDGKGALLEARIDELGIEGYRELLARRMAELGPVVYGRIVVRPFQVERFGTTFGLLAVPPDEDDGNDDPQWCVELQPGDYMAFWEPWDSGEYDT